jgi:hypothetical protein
MGDPSTIPFAGQAHMCRSLVEMGDECTHLTDVPALVGPARTLMARRDGCHGIWVVVPEDLFGEMAMSCVLPQQKMQVLVLVC